MNTEKSQRINLPKTHILFTGILSTVIVLFAVLWSYQNNVILSYGDAEARINIAKRVFHSLTPGLSQLGGVWLPLPQILMLPFVWHDFLWRTGLAGSIVSAISFIWSAVILYKLSFQITQDKIASYAAPLIWVTNPNSIYLATTPMSETLLFATVSSSLHYLIKWIRQKELSTLILSGLFGFSSTLIRYDGWFLVIISAFIILVVSSLHNKSISKGIGNTIVYALPASFGIFLWLLWNKLIFNDFLFFANSEYSSKTQQMWFYERGYLPTYKNLLLSFVYYVVCSWLVVGPLLAIGTMSAFINFLRTLIKKRFTFAELSVYLLFSPLAFYTISLYTGQASLILPTFAQDWYQWQTSNVRYGIQMLLPTAVFTSIFIANKNWAIKSLFVVAIIFHFYYLTFITKPIAYVDGTEGLSSQKISKGENAYPAEEWMSKNYNGGLVIMDDYRRPISPVVSGIPMQNFINVGTKPYWEESLDNPAKHAEWIIIQKSDTDAFWRELTNKSILEDSFSVVFRSGNIWIYKKNTLGNRFATKSGQRILLHGKEFYFYGANIYDLANTNYENIDILLEESSKLGIQVIRIWGFNKYSVLTLVDFKKLDYILDKAKSKGIKIIIVFGNQWSDYGGRKFFVEEKEELDSFYTNKQSVEKYKKHILSIVLRINSINGIQYKNDPTIFAWELINEPRMENDKSGIKVLSWIEEIAEYVQLIDPNHLVSVGTEGFMHDEDRLPYSENHGADFREICKLPAIDICSAHLYPKYFYEKFPNEEDIEALLERWQNIAEEANKPLYLGEVGFNLSDSTHEDRKKMREDFFKIVSKVSRRKNINGALLWNLTIQEDEFFSISPFNDLDKRLMIEWTLNY